ncbi:hypothetical protein GYMLUDRAFT_71928 [Collybiopsis luxurians FD-317 M1]|uniref:4-coumarate--CoA ligase n=1 Tax=Collybiopsis luxurians FD-317 M1 TaxID=944289 RepID=A0A0D0D3C7_9AGAR|nr:hypothetical protein GYMLUDRAFT_71928 [Collybiopsis luxurians FD-317 M1]
MSHANWKPKRSFEQVEKLLCAPRALHELETREIDGQVLRVYKNLWPSLRVFWLYVMQLHGDKTCVVFEDQRLTFAQLGQRAIKAASIFRNVYGVKKGDRIVICSRNCPEYLVIFWATHLIGAVSVLVNSWLPLEPMFHCIARATPSLVFVDPERADILQASAAGLKSTAFVIIEDDDKGPRPGISIWRSQVQSYHGDTQHVLKDDPRIVPEDNATIIFTSGTSGSPKGVLSSQRAFLSNLLNSFAGRGRAMLRRGEDLVFQSPPGPQPGILLPTPLFHVTGTSLVLIGALTGAKVVLMRKWNVEEGQLIKTENITAAGGVPTTVSDLVDSSASGGRLDSIMYGGAPVSASSMERARKAFPLASMSQAYGMTESNATVVAFAGEDYLERPSSCGRAMPINDILIMGPDSVRCPNGTVGEVWLRGPNVMKCYWDDPVATSKSKDNWLKTGDVGYLDDEGFLYIKDRMKDIIIRVLEAAAVGVADARLGEVVTALVTIKPSHKKKVTVASLMSLAQKQLPKFAVPVQILILEQDFNHTPSGKILKTDLRKIAAEAWAKRKTTDTREAKL